MKIKNQYQRNKLKKQIRLLTITEKRQLAIKLYLDNTTLKLLSSLFECNINYIIQLLEENDIKKCILCENVLSRTEFHKKDTADGLNHRCKNCMGDYRKQYYQDHKEESIKKSIEWKQQNSIRVSELRRKRNQLPKVKQDNANYQLYRRHHDPIFRLRCNFSNLISYSLTQYSNDIKSNHHWEDIVGYTLNELVNHLESQFQDGMTWDNYGQWHIDHIKPQSSFNFSSKIDSEFKNCWDLANLQPLWAIDNLQKSNHIIG